MIVIVVFLTGIPRFGDAGDLQLLIGKASTFISSFMQSSLIQIPFQNPGTHKQGWYLHGITEGGAP